MLSKPSGTTCFNFINYLTLVYTSQTEYAYGFCMILIVNSDNLLKRH
jgi:hypothetical protein